MSKRKQMRPSKFDIWKKGDDPSQPMTALEETTDELDEDDAKEEPDGRTDGSPIVDDQMDNGDQNIVINDEEIPTAVSSSSSLTSVIQSTNRKRTISALSTSSVIRDGGGTRRSDSSANGDYHHLENECSEARTTGSSPNDQQSNASPHGQLSRALDEGRNNSSKRAKFVNEIHQQAPSSSNQTRVLVDGRQLVERAISLDSVNVQRQFVKCFICPYCETGFSNPKTLEAHQTIYCTKKPAATDGKVSPNASAKPSMATSPNNDIHHRPHHRHRSTVDFNEAPVTAARVQHRSVSYATAAAAPPHIRVTTTRSPDSIPPIAPVSAAAAPSVILLPCAYSRAGVVQIIGKPQTIIPIAVPRSFTGLDFPIAPLLLDESLCTGIDITDFKLPLSNAAALVNGASSSNNNNKSSRFMLPLATRSSSVLNEGASTSIQSLIADALVPPSVRNGRPRSSEGSHHHDPRKRSIESRSRSPPLDLTKKPTFQDVHSMAMEFLGEPAAIKRRSLPHLKTMSVESSLTQPKTAPSPPPPPGASSIGLHPKNFACPKCGVAFSSRKTLDGHQAYYCKANNKSSSSTTSADVQPSSSSADHQQLQSVSKDIGASASAAAPAPQTFCCQYCDHSTTTVWQLLQHMKTAHSLGAAYLCTLCGYRGFSMRGMKSHLKHAHADEVAAAVSKSNASAAAAGVVVEEDDSVSKFVRRTKLFDEFDALEPDEEEQSRHSSEDSQHSEIVDVDTTESRKSNDSSPNLDTSIKNVDRMEQHGDEASHVLHSSSSTAADSQPSTSCPTLVSKFACQFCAYKSPYKGNVKRHLALVHKMERHTTTGD